ncbi:MAG: N-acetylneuraminate synthase [Bacteroidota bacterium]
MNHNKDVVVIAEAGVNHNGDIEMARQLVRVAADAGADFVKFQTFTADALVSRNAQKAAYQMSHDSADKFQYKMLKDLELSAEQHRILMEECRLSGIGFLSSAFDLNSLEYLNSLSLRYLKIPSGELTNLIYLRKAGSFNQHVLLSSGMCTMKEIEDAISILVQYGTAREQITLLHCNTAYPTPFEDVNLLAIPAMRNHFQLPVGYSDHTPGIEVAVAAVALGASVIEKHFTLNANLPGPDHKASLEPAELAAMIKSIRNIEKALGAAEKKPSSSELHNITIARKSMHLFSDVAAGHIISEADIIMKRPGDGISPMELDHVIGRRFKKALEANHKLQYDDFE